MVSIREITFTDFRLGNKLVKSLEEAGFEIRSKPKHIIRHDFGSDPEIFIIFFEVVTKVILLKLGEKIKQFLSESGGNQKVKIKILNDGKTFHIVCPSNTDIEITKE